MTSQQSSNPWFGLSMALVGVIVGYGTAIVSGGTLMRGAADKAPVVQNPTPTPTPTPTPQPEANYDKLIAFDPEVDYYRGNPNAKVAMIEYSDYECPFCQRHHPTMQAALDEYGDDVVWVFRHYPLSFHPNAQPAAEAAECVGEIAGNDKFWEFTDIVFEQGAASVNHEAYAEQIGVDITAFTTCVDSGKYAEKVQQQLAQGTEAGVRGTPGTFLFNVDTKETKYISGAQPLANIKTAIDGLL